MMLYYIINEGAEDAEFVKNRTEGYEEMKSEILKLNMDELSEITGVNKDLVREAALAYAASPAAMEFHGLGVTEHLQGTFTVQLIADRSFLSFFDISPISNIAMILSSTLNFLNTETS